MPATNELLQEGRYRISQRSSGDADIYEAYDTVRNTNVIVREIPVKLNKVTTVSQQESIKLAFATQAKALTEIDHDSLLHVHDFFSEIDRQYLVMEAVDGEDLRSILNRLGRPFAVSDLTKWADELLDALSYLHNHKPSIIHQNIRPQNLKKHPSGKIKLLGVGLDGGPNADFNPVSVDDNGDLRYLPIEQIWPGLDAASQKAITNSYDDRSERILKGPLDARSDIYSLGATFYFLMTGVEPVDPLERSIDMLEGKLDPLREPSKVDSRIPAEISDVLMKSLEIKRENRYDSALIMREVLKTAIARVEEREEEEVREQEEAADFIRMAATSKQAPAVSDEASELAMKKQLEEQQLRQVEEQRRAAEAQAQEAERLKAEQAAKAEAEKARVEEAARAEAERAQAEAAAIAEAERVRKEEEMKAEAERLRLQEEAAKLEAERVRKEVELKAQAERLRREEEEAAKAEAARLAREEEAKNALAAKTREENLLEIPAGAEVVAYRDSSEPNSDELAAVLEELAEAEAEAEKAERSSRQSADDADVLVIDSPVDTAPQPVATSYAEVDDDDDIFTVPAKSGMSLPMPAIAGVVGLVLVIAIGGWFMMSGSSEPPAPAPVQAVQVAQPSPEPSPATDQIVSTQSEGETAAVATDPSVDQAAQPKAAATPKAKKPEAAKPAEKKKVTVDDLINDN